MTQRQVEFQTLRERLVQLGKPVVLVGGIRKPDKIRLINERFGIDVEWLEIEDDSPKATEAIVRRIRSGRIAAILLLKDLVGHKTSRAIIVACQTCNIPWVHANRAGTATIEAALIEIERKLAL